MQSIIIVIGGEYHIVAPRTIVGVIDIIEKLVDIAFGFLESSTRNASYSEPEEILGKLNS